MACAEPLVKKSLGPAIEAAVENSPPRYNT